MATSSTDRKFMDYEGFVDKFKQRVTTDDCFTPPEVYEAVAGYVSERFGVARSDMVRPFYPGGDFEGFDYPPGCCVVDNPPFSILMRIKRFYVGRGIRFFLFALRSRASRATSPRASRTSSPTPTSPTTTARWCARAS